MVKSNFETQYSIYKVDYDASIKYFEEKGIEILSHKDLEEKIIEDIKVNVNKNNKNEIYIIKDNNFKGLAFKSYHNPTWSGMINNLLEEQVELNNIHISYILTYTKSENIFLLTGGLGSSYISEFTLKNYGLSLLPKITKEGNKTIKSVSGNRMVGNKTSIKHANRTATSIDDENDMSNIFKELSLEVDQDIIELLAVDNPKNIKKLNILARDSFIVKKSLTIENLVKILNNLIDIEKRNDNFALGYFIDAKKRGYTAQQLNELLFDALINKKLDKFQLLGNNYIENCIGCTKYIIRDEEDKIIYEEDQVTMEALFNKLSDNITKSLVQKLLKYNITVYREEEIVIPPTKLKSCIQANIENENGETFLLFNGNWLIFNKTYLETMKKEYKKIYEEITKIDSKLIDIISNKSKKESEDKYNNTFANSSEVILAHKVRVQNIEIADLIYYDNDNLYLIHNKKTFDGSGSRDVYGQILSSAELLSYIVKEKDKKRIFKEYYNKILKEYPNNKLIKTLTLEEFARLFSKAEIHYIVGFMERVTINKNSNYAKYLTIDTYKKLKEKGYNLLLFNINSN